MIQVCGPLPLSSSIIDPNASIANIARVILLGIYVSMTGKSQSILFDRATAMISETLHFSDLCTARNELLQQQCLTQLISHSENTVRNKVLHTIQSYLEGKEKVRSDVKLLELCAKSLPMKELLHPSDADSQQSTLQLLRLCVQYSMQASEMGVNDFDRFAVSLLVIRALLAFQSNQESKSPDVESILNNFTSKPVVGTVLLRYIQSLSKQSDYYLHLKANSTEISVSQADKLTHLFETISILLDCLIAHRIPNQVRSVMAKNMCLVAKCASTLHTAYKTKSKKQANLDYFLVAILSALRILDSFISVYVQSEVTDDVFHAVSFQLRF